MAFKAAAGAGMVLATVTAFAAQAQSNGVPAEFPPASFTGNQFVDSNGCAFIRAGIAGTTNWVPRVNRQRDQLCNFQPTFPSGVASASPVPLDDDLIINITPPATAPASAPAPVIAAPAPQPAPTPAAPQTRGVAAPIQTIASIPADGPVAPLPTIITPPPSSPQIIAAPSSSAPSPTPEVAANTTTLAQACDGRFGIQPGFVSATTGDPIDCGPAPQVAAADPLAGVPRMTLAQICAESAATGQRFVDAVNGNPIVCAPTETVTVAAAPAAPAAPARPAAPSVVQAPAPVATAATACVGIPNLRSDGRYSVRCGPQTERPYTEVATAPAQQQGRVSTSSAPLIGSAPVPASNPSVSTRAAVPNPPAGYSRVWTDGRINPQRGLVVQPAPAAAAPQARVSTRSVAPARVTAAPAHRYIQVGSFGDHANADRLIQKLGGMGLPVASGRSGQLKIVAAGPFADAAALSRAMQAIRGLGFTDAYTRN